MRIPFAALLLLVMFVAELSLEACAAAADEAPLRPTEIEKLTPELARRMVTEWGGTLSFNLVKSLDEPTAAALAGFAGQELFLSAVETLDAPTAKALARFKGRVLALSSLTTLDAPTAAALAEFKGADLHLNGLKKIDKRASKELLAYKGKLWTSVTLDPSLALAEQFPKDTNAIERLTPEQAAKLARWFPGVNVEIKAWGWKRSTLSLPLKGIKSIDAETAKALILNSDKPVLLDGLTVLTAETAQVLERGGRNPVLSLPALTTIDADTARSLGRFSGHSLLLDGLTTLDATCAAALGEFNGGLQVRGPATLDVATAAALSRSRGRYLSIGGVTRLDAATARALAGFAGEELRLPGLTALDADTAQQLLTFKGQRLFLHGPARLDIATARFLAGFSRDTLSISGPTTLDAAVAETLAGSKCLRLCLDGVTKLTPATARALSKFKWTLSLGGVSRADAGSIRSLTQVNELLLTGLTTLDPDTASALVNRGVWNGALPKLAELTPATAAVLRGYGGTQLVLDGLATLDVETATILAKSRRGQSLSLGGLTSLEVPSATALGQFAGERLELTGLTRLSPAVAAVLVENVHWTGDLPKLVSLDGPDSVAVAAALSRRQGRLALWNLRRISPQTLTALLRKEDVVLPLLDTLELIPEADGTLDETFVVPQEFLGLQKMGRVEVAR